MCGIAGFVRSVGGPREELEGIARAMSERILHRGPDDGSVWSEPTAGVAFAHRRLSIIDLSPTGRQPMTSASGRYVICYNGEIYNYLLLKTDLLELGATFRGTSDTEVLLAAVEAWGVDRALERVVGMYAIALWDMQTRTLHLVRDRLGEKPLYVATLPWGVAFASEIRAFEALPGWAYDVDGEALASLLRIGYVAGEASIDSKVRKIAPATLLSLSWGQGNRTTGPTSHVHRYWDLESAIAGTDVPSDAAAAVERLDQLLQESVAGQRLSDVPLGAFLSGGIDSSVVTAALQSVSAEPVRTFSIGFDDPQYDESAYARAVAAHLGCNHTEFRVTSAEGLAVVDQLADIFDEPLADPSQIPTVLVSRLARQAVTVCLSGDGGDELFGGYNRYFWSERWGRRLRSVPKGVRAGLGSALSWAAQSIPDEVIRRMVTGNLAGNRAPLQDPRGKLEKAAAVLKIDDPVERYRELIFYAAEPAELLRFPIGPEPISPSLRQFTERWGDVFGPILWDVDVYLHGDQLARVDRASMAVSLEMRAPLLDHRVAAFGVAATRAFGEARLAAQPKWLLREALYRRVPRALVDRPKMGFSVPLGPWLRTELREWADNLLSRVSLDAVGVFRDDAVRRVWDQHTSGAADRSRTLWPVLIFQQWVAAAQKRGATVRMNAGANGRARRAR